MSDANPGIPGFTSPLFVIIWYSPRTGETVVDLYTNLSCHMLSSSKSTVKGKSTVA